MKKSIVKNENMEIVKKQQNVSVVSEAHTIVQMPSAQLYPQVSTTGTLPAEAEILA